MTPTREGRGGSIRVNDPDCGYRAKEILQAAGGYRIKDPARGRGREEEERRRTGAHAQKTLGREHESLWWDLDSILAVLESSRPLQPVLIQRFLRMSNGGDRRPCHCFFGTVYEIDAEEPQKQRSGRPPDSPPGMCRAPRSCGEATNGRSRTENFGA